MDKERDMAGNHVADHGRRNFLQLAGCGLGVAALAAGPGRARAQTTSASPLKIGSVGAGRMGSALGALIGKAHGRGLATKPLVMDICNPIARRDGEDVVKWVNEQGGAGLASAKLMPGARIVRAFNAISYRRVGEIAHRPGGLVGVPIAGDDPKAIALTEGIIRGMGFEPVLVGGLAMGKYLLPGTPLAEEHTPEEIRKIAGGLR